MLHPCRWSRPSGHGRSSCSFGIASWGSSSPTQYHAPAIISTCIPMSRSSDYLHPKSGQRVVFMPSTSRPSDRRRFVTGTLRPANHYASAFNVQRSALSRLSPTHDLSFPSAPKEWLVDPLAHSTSHPGNLCHLHPNVPSQ